LERISQEAFFKLVHVGFIQLSISLKISSNKMLHMRLIRCAVDAAIAFPSGLSVEWNGGTLGTIEMPTIQISECFLLHDAVSLA
jgi:hypothetical protein